MRKIASIAALLTSVLFVDAFADYGGGSGAWPDDPFLISEPNHLLAIGENPGDWNKYFKLTADIDLAGHEWQTGNMIGNSGSAFTGIFDGDGHVIQNLNFAATDAYMAGLFAHTSYATIRNLGVVDAVMNVEDAAVLGALGGWIVGGVVENCYSTYTITVGDEAQAIGGLIGDAAIAVIENCYSNGTIVAGQSCGIVGGLLGSSSSTITGSHSSGLAAR